MHIDLFALLCSAAWKLSDGLCKFNEIDGLLCSLRVARFYFLSQCSGSLTDIAEHFAAEFNPTVIRRLLYACQPSPQISSEKPQASRLTAEPISSCGRVWRDSFREERYTAVISSKEGMMKSGCKFHVSRNAGAVVLQAWPLACSLKTALRINSTAIEMT